MIRTLFPALAMVLVLSACGRNNPAPGADGAVANATAPNASPTASAASAASTVGHGTGHVRAIDPAAGTVTIEHGSIPEANWPAMTMAFQTSPTALNGIAVGDLVSFDITITNGSGEVTAIRKVP